ncbi:NAD(P)/FAD-dependent oxidoreductase [Amycolatopsis sp. NPDC059021]|uniref:NAD(P)/FAD-dependent oxidoreductase n=1 Tax=Amycolatopsis sp. NPDC059021 TaxID=3346704 RepID=UPI00366E0784
MPRAVVVGGGVAGLTGAMALREAGYDVQVLDRDRQDPPASVEAANTGWVRPTVPQALHSHSFTSLGNGILRRHAPALHAALLAAGAAELDLTTAMPPVVRASPREPGDTELTVLACRRRTFDAVLAGVVRRTGVPVRRGTAVRGLVFDAGRVAGVRLTGGGTVAADLVIDATGRRGESRRWLSEVDIPVAADTVWPSRVTSFSRFYRGRGRGMPGTLNRGNAAGGVFDHYMAVVHPGDNGTFSIAIGVLPEDGVLKAVRDQRVFTALAAATPYVDSWVREEASEPVSPVYAMRCPDNVVRGVATTRQRPVPGLLQLGDAACLTSPVYGRGVGLAMAHAYELARLVAGCPEPGDEQSARAAMLAERLLVPWARQGGRDDEERVALWRATVYGAARPPAGDRLGLGDAAMASMSDAVVWRGLARVLMSLDSPGAFYDDPDIRSRVRAVLATRPAAVPTAADRDLVVRLVEKVAG